MSFSVPENSPEQLAAAHHVIDGVIGADPKFVQGREGLLDSIRGVSDAIGVLVVQYGSIPSLEEYNNAHFYTNEQESVYVLRRPLGRSPITGSERYFCAFRPTTRGAYMAVYDYNWETPRIRSDVLLPDEIDMLRLRGCTDEYETDGRAAMARKFRALNGLSTVTMPGAPESRPRDSQRYFRILQGLSMQLLAAADYARQK